MAATVEYEVNGETHSITRDVVHTEKDGYVIAYNEQERGVDRKVTLPKERVVIIYEGDKPE